MKTCLILAALALACGGAQGEILVTTAHLSGPAEEPTNESPGTGTAIVTHDSDSHTLRVQVSFSGLEGEVTASHIHAPVIPPETTAGVATQVPTFIGFPTGVTAGEYDETFDLTLPSSYRPAFITANGGTPLAAEAALAAALAAGRSYLNIHSLVYPGGEIRGFLLPDADADFVPDDVDVVTNSRDVGGTIVIEGCDTGVTNVLSPEGATQSDLIYQLADENGKRGGLSKLINTWRKSGLINGSEASAIRKCAGDLF